MKITRKTYAPFVHLLRSTEFQGVGACLAENVYTENGHLKKLRGTELWTDVSAAAEILWLGGYEKSDGTFQVLAAYKSGSIYLIRAIEEDKTVTTPSGGAGDVNFTSSVFDFTQLGTTGFISNESATTPLYSWDGTTLTAVTNAPSSPKFVLRDGNRIVCGNEFSSVDVSTNWDSGTNVNQSGKYATSLDPTGGIIAGSGVILFGRMGAEAHKSIPNDASDDISAKTKLENFNYTGMGIKNRRQVCAGKNFVYFCNEEGIHEMNPYDGNTTNLVEYGNIKKRWDALDTSNAVIEYDSENDRVCVLVRTVGQNNRLVVVEADKKERPISMQTESFYTCLANINNQLYGGDSQDGKIYQIFNTWASKEAGNINFRWIMEWDSLENPLLEKRLKRIAIFANLHPSSSFTAKLYKNGSTTAIDTETFSVSSSVKIPSTIGELGKYIFSLGKSWTSAEDNKDYMKRYNHTALVSTYALEITETSQKSFEVYDILLEYKPSSRLVPSLSLTNTLFS